MNSLRRKYVAGLLAAIVALLTLGSPFDSAHAEDFSVVGGDKVTLESKSKKIENVQASTGTYTVEKVGDGNSLVYTAPKVDKETIATVSYNADSGPVTKTIKITVPPLPSISLETGGKILVALLVMAILLENALALIFNWRPFLDFFDSRAVKPVIAFIVSYIFVRNFDLDAVGALMSANGGYVSNSADGKPLGLLITAMVVAGGSSAVNRLMQTFGVRLPSVAETEAQRPASPDHAWLSVTFRQKAAKGKAYVILQSTPAGGQPEPPQVIGAVDGSGVTRSKLISYFIRSRSRFPPSGGYALPPGTYKIWLEIPGGPRSETAWGPYAVAKGAIIDLDLEL